MADIEFQISDGPYAGVYKIDLADVSASDVGDLLAQHGPDLDAILSGGGQPGTRGIAGLVWLVRRRGAKGLAYRAVADNINLAMIQPVDDDTEEPAEKLPDPSRSADA